MTQARHTFQLGRTRLRDDDGAYESEPPTSYGTVEDAAAKLAEWSEGKVVFVGADEYMALRGAYEEKLKAQSAADEPTTGGPTPPAETPPAAPASTTAVDSHDDTHLGGQAFKNESGAASPIGTPSEA